MGLGRFVVVAETDAAALALARRAYPKWYQSFTHLRRLHGGINAHPRPSTFDGLVEAGQGVAGSPLTVATRCVGSWQAPAAIIVSASSPSAI